MSTLDVLRTRRSIRRYANKAIPDAVLREILGAAQHAPSAANRQPYHFIVITDAELKRALSKGLWNRFVKAAPVTIVGCADTNGLTGKWAVIDTTIALQNMVIAAWSLGVGSCWIGDFNEPGVKAKLHIPEKWRVVALLTLGYPVASPRPRTKKAMDDLVSVNAFS
jgi:nitroreductase